MTADNEILDNIVTPRSSRTKNVITKYQAPTFEYAQDNSWSELRYRHGYKNPYWKTQVLQHVQAGTSFTGEIVRHYLRPVYLGEFYTWHTGVAPGYYLSEVTSGPTYLKPAAYEPGNSLESQANNAALGEFVSKLNNKITPLQGGVMLGELRETVRLLRNPVQSIKEAMQFYVRDVRLATLDKPSFRRMSKRQRRKNGLAIAQDTWLTYAFGMRPFIQDVGDIINHIADKELLGLERHENVTAWSSRKGPATPAYGPSVPAGGVDPFLVGVQTWKYSHEHATMEVYVKYKGQVLAGNENGAFTAQNVGFAPSAWLPTIWELVPYSFAIDYFTNVGDIIEAATLATSKVAWVIKTVRKTFNSEFIFQPEPVWRYPEGFGSYPATPPYVYSYTVSHVATLPPVSKYFRKTIQRDPYNDSLVPDLAFSMPAFGSKKWLNLAALFQSSRQVERVFR